MQSNRFFYHKQLSLLIFRSVGWVSILSFFIIFFSVPMQLLLINKKLEEDTYYFDLYQYLFSINNPFQMAVIILLPILLAIFLFRFIQNKAYSDLVHSLPLSRKFLFHYYSINGLILLLFPVLLNGLFLRIIYPIIHLERLFPVSEIYYWTAIFCLFSILLFVSCVFIGMLTGLSILQGVFTCLFLLFPTCIFFLVCYNFHDWIYGFPIDDLLTNKALFLSPILVPAIIEHRDAGYIHYIVYSICAVILYFGAFFLYQKRKAESISQSLAFFQLKGIFKYIFTFSCMLIGSLYGEVAEIGKIGNVIGSFFGALFGYLVAEMLIHKQWRVFFTIRKFPIFIGSILLLIAIMIPFVKMYEDSIPNTNAVQSVSVFDNYITQDVSNERMMDSKENIKEVILLHKELVAQKKQQRHNNQNSLIRIHYKLNNGKKIYRNYPVNRDAYEKSFKAIYESKEFKTLNSKIFATRSDEVNDILLTSIYKNEYVRLGNNQEIKEFLAALQQDKLAESYESMTTSYAMASNIAISFKRKKEDDEAYTIQLSPMYKESRKWLKDRGLLEKSTATFHDIKEIKIAKTKDLKLTERTEYDTEYVEKMMQEIGHTVVASDNQDIQKIVDYTAYRKEKYAVLITYNFAKQTDVAYISEKNIPKALKKKLEKN
ncbi:MAG: DUF6449 domain-containing protein [Bacillus sp. (in: firmicutes)]